MSNRMWGQVGKIIALRYLTDILRKIVRTLLAQMLFARRPSDVGENAQPPA